MSIRNFAFFMALVVLACFGGESDAQTVTKDLYAASAIPDSLKENANSVVRYSYETDSVVSPTKMLTKIHTIITVLNEKADREAIFYLPYDKYTDYSSVVMRVYDANGNTIKKYHKSDMEDFKMEGPENLVEDGRILALKHTIPSYPMTIEKEYEVQLSSFFDIGDWEIERDQQSVQNSYYHIAVNDALGFRYQNKNTSLQPKKGAVADNVTGYSWEVKNLKAIKLEEGAEGWRVFPHIYFSQNSFNMQGYPGQINTWQAYGKWQKDLNADVCSLTPEREAEIKKMTDTIKSDKDKARFLYKYMQQSMRYVSIQLGIGGWKPFTATFVDQKKYGDCKALSNYMSALLKAVGIPSCYAIINAGANEEPADFSFPRDPFNHVILCVPFKGDTTWLECTSSTQPFGKLGSFTENRTALIITDDGGKLVRTPRSTVEDNQLNSNVQLTLDADGGAKANVKILSTGTYRDDYIGITALKTDEQREFLMHRLNLKQPISFNISNGPDNTDTKEVSLDLEYDKFCDIKAGDKQFYRPHVFDLVAFTLPEEEKRKSDYYFETPMEKSCTTTIKLPAGFEVETLPVNQIFKFTYGDYDVNYSYDAAKNQVISTAKFKITNQVIPAAKYAELQEFLDNVEKAQNKKLVIRRKAA